MTFVELSSVQDRIRIGTPLPFHVRDADQTLLLARGQVIDSAGQLNSLMKRGALVDSDEVAAPPAPIQQIRPDRAEISAGVSPRAAIRQARPDQLPALLRTAMTLASRALNETPSDRFAATVDTLSDPLLAIVERDPDLAIFQILRQEGNYLTQYGVNHSIHCAITVFLITTRLGWTEDDVRRAFKAALTMNLSMLELQGQLATQATPMTDDQRADVLSHPQRSVAMLEKGGITDGDWLRAIALHHDEAGDAGELAGLLHRADVYTAKLSPRRNREALGADVAARMMFSSDRGHPANAAIVKEFGLYPPGCHVKLASGETGIVVRRGEQAHTPWVAATTNPQGTALPQPLRRDTAQRPFSVAAVLRQGSAGMRFTPEVLLRACA